MLKLPHHKRYDFLPITKRKHYSWPGGKRLAFYVALNIEDFAFRQGAASTANARIRRPRELRWRDYGNRVGIWRLFELLDELKFPAQSLNSSVATNIRTFSSASSSAATRSSDTAGPTPTSCADVGR